MFRKILPVLGIISCLAMPQHARAASLLVNGDFEQPIQTTPGIFATFNIPNAQVPIASTYITGWTVFQGNVDLTTTANYGPLTNTLDLGSKQDVDLIGDSSGSGGVFGGMSQSFTTTAGQKYRLTFDYSHNPGTLSQTGNYIAQVKVVDGNAPANNLFSGQVSQANGPAPWVAFSQDFTATSDLTTLMFIDTAGGFNAGIYLDDVSVDLVDVSATTPIPAALPLFASGLAGVTFLARRKKRKAQPATA